MKGRRLFTSSLSARYVSIAPKCFFFSQVSMPCRQVARPCSKRFSCDCTDLVSTVSLHPKKMCLPFLYLFISSEFACSPFGCNSCFSVLLCDCHLVERAAHENLFKQITSLLWGGPLLWELPSAVEEPLHLWRSSGWRTPLCLGGLVLQQTRKKT